MAREKFSTLTEQMFYILLCLREECCGMDVMARVNELTGGRVAVGPGTLYNLLEQFLAAGYIVETRAEGRRRSYQLTAEGETLLQNEVERLQAQVTTRSYLRDNAPSWAARNERKRGFSDAQHQTGAESLFFLRHRGPCAPL